MTFELPDELFPFPPYDESLGEQIAKLNTENVRVPASVSKGMLRRLSIRLPLPDDSLLEATRGYYEHLKEDVCFADGENGPSEYDYLPTYKELWKQASSEVRGQRNGTAYEYLNHLGF